MPSILDNARRPGLIANITLLLAAVLLVNGLIFGLGWRGAGTAANAGPMIPPGAVVGLVWTALLALMGVSRWLYVRETRDAGWLSWAPFLLAAVCLAYPFYTDKLSDPELGFWGTFATLGVAVAVIVPIGMAAPRAAWPLVPTLAWLGYVGAVMLIFAF